MIEKLNLSNFTVFPKTDFSFAKGINVVIGSNGVGKSHLIKLAYSAVRWSREMAVRERVQTRPDKATLQKELATKLTGVFRCEGLGRLSSRGQGVHRSEVGVHFLNNPAADFAFHFSTRSVTDATLDQSPEKFWVDEAVFFPTKEMLTMYPGFAALYRDYALQIDETYYDLCLELSKPLPRGAKLAEVRPMLDKLESLLHGSVELENDRFYLVQRGGRFEMPLVAEGFRKLAAVAYLLANGALSRQSMLFWDEPETNLNPAYMVDLASLLVQIAANSTQVFIATHSLFMMREISLQLSLPVNSTVASRFFALSRASDQSPVHVASGQSAEEVEPITALDAEIEQSERYLRSHANGVAG